MESGEGGGVERGLVRGHREVVTRGEVPTLVARPAEVERLTLDGALLHLRNLLEHAQLGCAVERFVLEHAPEGANDAEVTNVDGHANAFGAVHAGLATAHLALVGDVVVDEGCGLEVLYCGRGREGAREASPPTASQPSSTSAGRVRLPPERVKRANGS